MFYKDLIYKGPRTRTHFFNEIKENLLKVRNLFCFLKGNRNKYTSAQTVI